MWALAAGTDAATRYLDEVHPAAADTSDHGTIDAPWRTAGYALDRLEPGDTLLVREGVYEGIDVHLRRQHSGKRREPIVVRAFDGETPVFRGDAESNLQLSGVKWWTFDGIVFENLELALGSRNGRSVKDITLRNCEFRDSSVGAIAIVDAKRVLIESCVFRRIQSEEAGKDRNAIVISDVALHVTIRDCLFEDISADGVQLGHTSKKIKHVVIEDSIFRVNRNPDGTLVDEELQAMWGNTGENGIDVKTVKGPVLIRRNVFSGFRPPVPGQNTSGGNGVAVAVHIDAKRVVIERNLFVDNTIHVVVARGSRGKRFRTRDVTIRNNVFRGARESDFSGEPEGGVALSVSESKKLEVHHNTFVGNGYYLWSWDTKKASFRNNVVVGGDALMGPNGNDWDSDYNLWFGLDAEPPDPLPGAHDVITTDPLLDGDLRPISGSPVVDAGDDLRVEEDFDGVARHDGLPDIGAFEHADFD